jgi:hypothetical protein
MALKEDMPFASEVPSNSIESTGTMSGDGTRQLLHSGAWTLATGLLAVALAKFVFGGIGPEGPHTNSGWLALIVAMMCLPFGSLLLLLGIAKWMRNRTLHSGHKS